MPRAAAITQIRSIKCWHYRAFSGAAEALASLVPEGELCADRIIPEAFDKRVAKAVAAAVAKAARESGVARV